MEVDDALEMFWEQEAANDPIPQFSESNLSEVGDDEDDWHDALESSEEDDPSSVDEGSGSAGSDSGGDVSEEEDSFGQHCFV